MASDVAGDIVSGIAVFGIYTAFAAAALFTGGASIAIGAAASTASGALIHCSRHDDEDYVKFVEMNKNKDLTEIEPAEYREPIIKALAAINSNTRKAGRSYNEMYGSNPKGVLGVFVYDKNNPSNVDNPLNFLAAEQI